jgi:hypothetical protein
MAHHSGVACLRTDDPLTGAYRTKLAQDFSILVMASTSRSALQREPAGALGARPTSPGAHARSMRGR